LKKKMSQFTNERGIRHGGNNTFGESVASGPAPTTAGHHKHDVLNKLDPRVDSTQDRRPMPAAQNVPEGTYGPHRSRIANALDPRVDSDMDGSGHRNNMNAASMNGPAMHGGRTAGPMGTGATQNVSEGTYGPHTSRVANAMDPRVDSDRDNRAAGAANPGYMYSSGGGGAGAMGGGGYGQSTTAAGLHNRPMGTNAAAAMSGPGPAPNTAGPHRSDLLNKLDPRVDSKTGMRKEPGYSERRGI
jgi:hypothetical protein